MNSPYLTAAFLVLIVGASWTDLRWRRIPNGLVAIGFATALALHASSGAPAVVSGFLGAGLGLVIALPAYACGALGAGDAKLLSTVGMFLGLERLPEALVLIVLAGAALGIAQALRRGRLLDLVKDTAWLALFFATRGRHGVRRTLETPGAVAVPYGIAVSIGALGAWLT